MRDYLKKLRDTPGPLGDALNLLVGAIEVGHGTVRIHQPECRALHDKLEQLMQGVAEVKRWSVTVRDGGYAVDTELDKLDALLKRLEGEHAPVRIEGEGSHRRS